MLPSGDIVTTSINSPFLKGDATGRPTLLEDYELGGIALNDTISGRNSQTWKCWYSGTSIFINSQINSTPIEYLTGLSNITELSFTFDTSMQPIIAYMQLGILNLRYYSTSLLSFTTITITEAISPILSYDDKRDAFTSTSDAQLFYIKNSNIYYRQQRDNYSIEYLFTSNVPSGRILNVGMNYLNRLQVIYKKDIAEPISAKTVKAELYSNYNNILVDTKIVEIASCQDECSTFSTSTWVGQPGTLWAYNGYLNSSGQTSIISTYSLKPLESRSIEITLVIENKEDQPFNDLFWLPNNQVTLWLDNNHYMADVCSPDDTNVSIISRDALVPSDNFTFNITITRTDLP